MGNFNIHAYVMYVQDSLKTVMDPPGGPSMWLFLSCVQHGLQKI